MAESRRLHSWKEIAVYLGRSVATVQRWEREEQMPVHRHFHRKLASVHAFTTELDDWIRTCRSETPSVPDFDQFQELGRLLRRAYLRGDARAAEAFGAAQLRLANLLNDPLLRAEAHIALGLLRLNDGGSAAEHVRRAQAELALAEPAANVSACRTLFVEACVLAALARASRVPA